MSLTCNIFGEEHVTGQECLLCAVTKPNDDATGESYNPATMRRAMIVDDMGSEIVSEQQSRGRPHRIEKL